MLGEIARRWWLFAVRGVAAIAFGILALAWPERTLTVLVALFGAYVLVDGAAYLIAIARGEPIARRHVWAYAAMGVLGIVVGILTFLWPNITALTLLYFVAFWAITMGVIQFAVAVEYRRVIEGEFWLALGGILSVAFGILLLLSPGDGLISVVWLVGIWAIAFGVSNLGAAYRLHGLKDALNEPGSVG